MEVDGRSHSPAALPPGVMLYPFNRRVCGPQGRSGLSAKTLAPPELDAIDLIVVMRLSKIEEAAERPHSNTNKLQKKEDAMNLHQPP